jgi:hypothetical protein
MSVFHVSIQASVAYERGIPLACVIGLWSHCLLDFGLKGGRGARWNYMRCIGKTKDGEFYSSSFSSTPKYLQPLDPSAFAQHPPCQVHVNLLHYSYSPPGAFLAAIGTRGGKGEVFEIWRLGIVVACSDEHAACVCTKRGEEGKACRVDRKKRR